MFQVRKYLLLPNQEQAQMLSQWEGSTRWLWNYFVDLEQKQYAQDKTFKWQVDLINTIPGLKQQHDWLLDTPSQTLQQVGKSIDTALKRMKKVKGTGFIKFKKKGVRHGQILIPNQVVGKFSSIIDRETHVKLPKIGLVKWKKHRDLPEGKIKSASITKDIDKWYISLTIETLDIETLPINPAKCKSIGIDLGISSFLVDSNGNKVDSPKFLKQKEKRLKRYQRQMARKKLGSNNRKKSRNKVAKIHRDIRNCRSDWLHKLSNEIVSNNDLICVEDLKTKSLVMHKKQKSLNRAISDQGWAMFLEQLKYKSILQGKTLTQISQWDPSTKTCSCCGHVMDKMALDIRNWQCPACGSDHDRDINAAYNIRFWGVMMTTNTEGTSGINACGVSSDLGGELFTTEIDTRNQEACGSLVHR